MVKRWMTIALVLAAVVLGACSDDGGQTADGGDTGDGGGATSSTTSTSVLRVPAISFTDRSAAAVDLGDGWKVGPCEGDAPITCVTRNGEHTGIIELSTFPVDSFHQLSGLRDAIDKGDDEAALEIIAADFVRTLQADRKDGCGADYLLEASPTSTATVMGKQGLRYGYVGRKGSSGPIIERQIVHAAIDGDELLLVNAAGYAAEGCVPPEAEFTPERLTEFERYLPGLVAAATR